MIELNWKIKFKWKGNNAIKIFQESKSIYWYSILLG